MRLIVDEGGCPRRYSINGSLSEVVGPLVQDRDDDIRTAAMKFTIDRKEMVWVYGRLEVESLLACDLLARETGRVSSPELAVGVGEAVATAFRVQSYGTNPIPALENYTEWSEILAAVGMKANASNKRKVVRLNHEHDGPIIIGGRGRRPFVIRHKLLEWWNSLESRFQELESRSRDVKASVSGQHPFGRSSTVVPEIGGAVKARRRPHT